MLFQLNINQNEDDYLAFNYFHSFESVQGKKTVRNSCFIFVGAMVILAVLIVLIRGWTTFSITYAAVLLLFALLYLVFFKKMLTRNVKTQIERLKKVGKLPFDPVSTFEFYEDKMVEITPSARIEQNYSNFERICIVKDRYIFLYRSSVSAYVFPIAQINTQLNQKDFVAFLFTKCNKIEYY